MQALGLELEASMSLMLPSLMISGVATLGPTGALALPSTSVGPTIKIYAYHVIQFMSLYSLVL